MNDKFVTLITNLLNNCIDCAGIDQNKVIATDPKSCTGGKYVDVCIEEYTDEELAYFVGFLAQTIGMKNIWLDTYPSSKRAHLELVFDYQVFAE